MSQSDFYSGIKPHSLKRFMSVFCKRRGADAFFMVKLPAVSVFTFYLFWVKTQLSQHEHRGALLCSKMEKQIFHENKWFDIFFAFLWFIFLKAPFLLITRANIQKVCSYSTISLQQMNRIAECVLFAHLLLQRLESAALLSGHEPL